jgi:AraC-like DNA-binding protein
MIIHASGRRVAYPEHNGPLSIKCAFGGNELYDVDGERHVVNGNNFLILNDGSRYASRIDSESEVEALCIFFRPGFSLEVFTAMTTSTRALLDDPTLRLDDSPTFVEHCYPHTPMISPILFDLRERSALKAGEEWLDGCFHALMERLLLLHMEVGRKVARLPAVRRGTRIEIFRRLERARDFIDSNLEKKIPLADMAAEACLSPHHFLRLFKFAYLETPHQYLTSRRIERARALLSTTDAPISEICTKVGFDSLGSFSWLFRRRVGTPPENYRKQTRGERIP